MEKKNDTANVKNKKNNTANVLVNENKTEDVVTRKKINMANVYKYIAIVFAFLAFGGVFMPQFSVTINNELYLFQFYDVLFMFPTCFGFVGYIFLFIGGCIFILAIMFFKDAPRKNVTLVLSGVIITIAGIVGILHLKQQYIFIYPGTDSKVLQFSLGPLFSAGVGFLSPIVALFSIYINAVNNQIAKEI